MAEKIKKHWSLTLALGIGLIITVMGLITMVGKLPKTSEVLAATTATVTVSATVAQTADLTVAGTSSGISINGSTTDITTLATSVPFGTLSVSANRIGAQILTMTTNAGNGYTVYIKYNNKLRSTATTSWDIDDHTGTNATPTSFSAAGTEAFGYTTEDFTLGTGSTTRFTGGKWAGATTTDAEIAYHNAPVSATTTKIGFQAGMSGLTQAATDYTCMITYTMVGSF
jgi:hypothetical protein